MLFRFAGICALALVAAKPKGGKGGNGLDGLDGLSGLSELNNMAEQLKDVRDKMTPESWGDPMANMMVMAMDKDQNGILSKEEIDAVPKGDQDIMEGNAEEMFPQMDLDGDGEVTRKEATAYFSKVWQQRGNTFQGINGMMDSFEKTDL